MNVYEIMQSSGAVVNCFRKKEQEIATELLRNLVAKAFEEGKKEGGAEAVYWLEEVYGSGVRETDAWAEYVGEEAGE